MHFTKPLITQDLKSSWCVTIAYCIGSNFLTEIFFIVNVSDNQEISLSYFNP